MTVRLRLQRQGKPKRPYYRLVVINQTTRRDGKPIEVLGQYDPMAIDEKIKVNRERVDYWISQGAKSSDTVSDLLKIQKETRTTVSKKESEVTKSPSESES
ncbi:MAG: 30S ribosomal protein S16 [Elusimicrobia bacterium]|nr:30S ribosomal protein S16 [Candidatus Liberimonas magnetica]